MKKRIVSLFLILLLASSSITINVHTSVYAEETNDVDERTNLIQNPSFETGDESPNHWRFSNLNTEGTWKWDTEESFEGNKSVKLTTTGADQRVFLQQTRIPVKAGASYHVQYHFRAEDFTGESFVRIAWFDNDGKLLDNPAIYADNNADGWTAMEGQVHAPANTAHAVVQIHVMKGTGSVWFDQVALEKSGEANLIKNPGFESGQNSPDHWRFLDANTNGTWAWDTEEKYEGERSVKLILNSASDRAIIDQRYISVGGGTVYQFSTYAKTEDFTGIPFIKIYWYDSSKQATGTPVNIELPNTLEQWTKISEYIVAPDDAVMALLQMQVKDGTGSVWYDQVEWTALSQEPGITPQNDTFNLDSTVQKDIAILLNKQDASLQKLKIGDTSLKKDNDYTVSGNMITLQQSFLTSLPTGKIDIIFDLSDGSDPVFALEVIDVPIPRDHENLIHNAGFEWGEERPYYWSVTHENNASEFVWAESESGDAGKFVKLIAEDADAGVSLKRANLSVHPRKSYQLHMTYSADTSPEVQWLWYDQTGELLQIDQDRPAPVPTKAEYAAIKNAPQKAAYLTLVFYVQGKGWMQLDDIELRQILVSADGEPIPVAGVVDINEPLPPAEFWAKFPSTSLNPPDDSIWTVKSLRNFFQGYGKGATGDYQFNVAERLIARDKNVPVVENALGSPVDPNNPLVIAEDIDFRPFLKGHSSYSEKYYPRRMHDYLLSDYIPSYVSTEKRQFKERAKELIGFLRFSQWTKEGGNPFTSKYFPDEYALRQEWAGGWDYLFDWEWLDAYGYKWSLHEPDHHVNSQIAYAMMNSIETLDIDQNQLEIARDFVYHQMPRYGFHKGKWNGHIYYWTEYNPTGGSLGNPTSDATDNIVALAAAANATLGFYETDETMKRRYLEFARGLLWYLVREFTYDGRFYYDGAENPLNPRKAISHDSATVVPAFTALAYLYKAGVDVDVLLDSYAEIDEAYLEIWDKQLEMHKIYDGTPAPNTVLSLSTFLQIKNNSYENAVFKDTIPNGFVIPEHINLRISEILPPDQHDSNWHVNRDRDIVLKVTPEQLESGVEIPFKLEEWSTYKISYPLTTTSDFKVKTEEDVYKAKELLPPEESSGKEYKLVLGDAVFYRGEEAGDYLALSVDVEEEGLYTLSSSMVQSPLYGKVQVSVDGQPVGEIYDGYYGQVKIDKPFEHGEVYLTAGEHLIRYEIVGKNAESGNYFLGIDKIELRDASENTGAELRNSSLSVTNGDENETYTSDTMSLGAQMTVNSLNFLSFNARVLFPFADEVNAKLVTDRIPLMLYILDHFKEEVSSEEAYRALAVHLTAVERFEQQEAADKVVKHMKGFKQLLDHQKENDLISVEAYNALKANAEALINQ